MLLHFRTMRAQPCGNRVLLVFDADIGSAFFAECRYDSDVDALHLVKATEIVRHNMFEFAFQFGGSFPAECHKTSVPQKWWIWCK
jgi:hypothetical protein